MEKEVISDNPSYKHLYKKKDSADLKRRLVSYYTGNPEVDIFIICFRDFLNQWNLRDKTYKLLSDNDIINYSWLEWIKIENREPIFQNRGNYWYELNKMWAAATHLNLKKYVGFLHPRQRFAPILDTFDIPKIFQKHEIIMPARVHNRGTIYNHYQYYLRISDLDLALDIMDEKFPEYSRSADEVLSQPMFYMCNTFIMKKEDFLRWTDFQFKILFEYTERMGFENEKIISQHMEKHINEFGNYRIIKEPNHFNSPSYLGAIVGHLSERLLNVWVHHNFKREQIYEVPLIEGEYLNNW